MNEYNEVFVIARSYLLTKKYGSLSFEERVNLLCQSITIDDRKLFLNMFGEGLFAVNLVEAMIPKLGLDKSKFKIILGVDPKGRLSDYDVEVNVYGFCNGFNFYTKLQREHIDWKNITLQHKLIALAHRSTVTRALYIKDLLDFYQKDVLVSFGFDGQIDTVIQDYMKPYTVPITIDLQEDDIKHVGSIHINPPNKMFQSLFNLVLETNELSNDEVFITEKSFKPFAWHQIPIYVVRTEHLNKMRDLGFDMFDDILDNHKYNNGPIENYRQRVMSTIRKVFDRYPTLTDMQNLRNNLWDRFVYNNNLLNKLVLKDNYDWSQF